MESEKTGELVLEGLLIVENGRLVGQDGMHVSAKGLHILGDEDSVLLGLSQKASKQSVRASTGSFRSRVGLDGASPEVG